MSIAQYYPIKDHLYLIDDPAIPFPPKGIHIDAKTQKAIDNEKAKSPLHRVLETLEPNANPLLFWKDALYKLPEQAAQAIQHALLLGAQTPYGVTDPLYDETTIYDVPRYGKTVVDQCAQYAVDIWRASHAIGKRTVVWIDRPLGNRDYLSDEELRGLWEGRKDKVLAALAMLGGFAPTEPTGLKDFASSPEAVSRLMEANRGERMSETMVHVRSGLGTGTLETDAMDTLSEHLSSYLRNLSDKEYATGPKGGLGLLRKELDATREELAQIRKDQAQARESQLLLQVSIDRLAASLSERE